MPSPGRPGVDQREARLAFWECIAVGLSSEDAALAVGVKLPIDPIQRARRMGIADGRAHDLAANDATQSQPLHESLDGAARDHNAFAVHLLPDLVGAVDPPIGMPDTLNVRHPLVVALRARTAQRWIACLGGVTTIARRGDPQHTADRRGPASTSTRLTHSSNVCGTQPIFGAIDSTAAHSDGYSPRCACTRRTARSRTSGENFFDLFMAPFSQRLEPPPNPGRFIQRYTGIAAVDEKAPIIVEAQAHGTGSEQELLVPIVTATHTYRTATTVIAADAGYHSEANLNTLTEQKVDAYIPDNGYRKRDERYVGQSIHKEKADPLWDKTAPSTKKMLYPG